MFAKIFELTHIYNGKIISKKKWDVQRISRLIFGTTHQCNIRLLGENVDKIHATIEFGEKMDFVHLSPLYKSYVQSKEALTHTFHLGQTFFQLGGNQFFVEIFDFKRGLFENIDSLHQEKSHGGQVYQQIVVKQNNSVLFEDIVSEDLNYDLQVFGLPKLLSATRSFDWKQHYLPPNIMILQRLVVIPEDKDFQKFEWKKDVYDASLEKPMFMAISFLMILFLGMQFIPQFKNQSLVELKEDPPHNRYVQLVYNSKVLKEKKKQLQSKKISQSHIKKVLVRGKTAFEKQRSNQFTGKTKLLSGNAKQHFSQLIGKISRRRVSGLQEVAASGQTPDKAYGEAFAKIAKVAHGTNIDKFREKGNGIKGLAQRGIASVGSLNAAAVGKLQLGILEEETEVSGGLEKDVIARYIESQLGQIRYCYERQLSANPDLLGKIQVKFTIGASGKVVEQKIGQTTLNNQMVEGCILRRVTAWKFPAPKGGTQVFVSYPFLFKSQQ